MSRSTSTICALAGAAALAVVLAPATDAAASTACVAWGTLPSGVSLGPDGVSVTTTLQGTSACTGVTADAGGTATLQAPNPRDNEPIQWDHLGATDTVTFYASLTRPGTYTLVDGNVQTYDARYYHIPATWHPTSVTVKYRSRLVDVTRSGGSVHAVVEFYDGTGWRAEQGVTVELQRRASAGSWSSVASTHSSSTGALSFAASFASGYQYRLLVTSVGTVWGTTHVL